MESVEGVEKWSCRQHCHHVQDSMVETRKVLQARSTYGRMADLARNSLPGPMKPEVKMSLVGMRLLLKGPWGGPADARYGLPSSIGPLPPRHFRCQMESRIKWCTMIRAALGRRTVHDTALLKGKAHAGFPKENCRILGRPLSKPRIW